MISILGVAIMDGCMGMLQTQIIMNGKQSSKRIDIAASCAQ